MPKARFAGDDRKHVPDDKPTRAQRRAKGSKRTHPKPSIGFPRHVALKEDA